MSLVNCLIGSPKQVDYENIPTAVFSTPEFATVGLSEESARKRFRNIEIIHGAREDITFGHCIYP